jgi:hypothetical protein
MKQQLKSIVLFFLLALFFAILSIGCLIDAQFTLFASPVI